LLQMVPALTPGTSAQCARCPTILRRASAHRLDHIIALTVAALVLLAVMCTSALMSVETVGIRHVADLFSGPAELVRQDMAPLAAVVLFVTVLAPFIRLFGTLYVLVRAHENMPPHHLRRVFALCERLRPWSMLDVFVLGVLVAYAKLGGLVEIGLRAGVYALFALTVVFVWVDAALDREKVWERLDHGDRPDHGNRPGAMPGRLDGAVGCETCGLVSLAQPDDRRCPRCGSILHRRRPNSVARTWALVIAAAILYIPANYYPVLTVVQLGAGMPSTIIGGVEELIQTREYPLAALVFFASILVPVLKLVGLSVMLTATQTGHAGWLRDRTRLYHIIRFIGRWSMIDIFMESLLGALVTFGAVITIQPGMGALAFCAVVVLTMFAAETFEPRLMWDAAASGRAPTAAGAGTIGASTIGPQHDRPQHDRSLTASGSRAAMAPVNRTRDARWMI
ncbi:MAG: paraquat-inducible protein A, partial [Stellaceae bacterium]